MHAWRTTLGNIAAYLSSPTCKAGFGRSFSRYRLPGAVLTVVGHDLRDIKWSVIDHFDAHATYPQTFLLQHIVA